MKVVAGAICLSFLFAVASPEPTAADFFELARTGSIQEVQAAISHGQSVDQRDSRGRTPLMWAAESNASPDVIAALCNAGSDPSARDMFGLDALMHAARSNLNPAIITALLAAGADVNAQNGGITALMYAAEENPNPEVIIVLLNAGADAKATDLAGNTVLCYARYNKELVSSDAYKTLVAAAGFDPSEVETPCMPSDSTGVDENRSEPKPAAPASEQKPAGPASKPKPAWPAFFLSVFVGFGTGQYYCGTNGTTFLLCDFLGLAMTVAIVVDPFLLMQGARNLEEAFLSLFTGPVLLLVSRIWQIFDVFWAIDEARRYGRVAEVVPALDVDIQRTSLELGVSLRY